MFGMNASSYALQELRKEVLRGGFYSLSSEYDAWKIPSFKLLVFISSTFTDTKQERDYLMDHLLFELRELARPAAIQVIFADMRWGVRDENTSDHKTWVECANSIAWCKSQSAGISFLFLQADKYGYRPLPQSIPRVALDAHLAATVCSPQVCALIYEWYELNTNAIIEEYVLKPLLNHEDPAYWAAYQVMLPALAGIAFDADRYGLNALHIGESVTAWEFQAAMGDCLSHRNVGGGQGQRQQQQQQQSVSAIWSHRELEGDVNDTNYCDWMYDSALKCQLLALKLSMKSLVPPCATQEYRSIRLTLKDLVADTIDNNPKQSLYLQQYKEFVSSHLKTSLDSIIRAKSDWIQNGCDLGLTGNLLSEMLHHADWARKKCSSFFGRATLVEHLIAIIDAPFTSSGSSAISSSTSGATLCNATMFLSMKANSTSRRAGYHDGDDEVLRSPYNGISACVVGISGAGKTSLMARVASEIFTLSRTGIYYCRKSNRSPLSSRSSSNASIIAGATNGTSSSTNMKHRSEMSTRAANTCTSPINGGSSGECVDNTSITSSISSRKSEANHTGDYYNDTNRDCSNYDLTLTVAAEEKEMRTIPIIVRFCGTSAGSRNARSLIVSICAQLEVVYDLKCREASALSRAPYNKLVKYFQGLLNKHPVILFIDALDQLTDSDQGRSQISFLKNVKPHPHTRIIVSCLPDDTDSMTIHSVKQQGVDKQRSKYMYQCETRLREGCVPRLDMQTIADSPEKVVDDAIEIIDCLLRQRGRTLTPTQRQVVRSRVHSEKEKTALYLNLVVQAVSQWNSSTDVADKLHGGVEAMIEQFFRALERQYGSVLVKAALGFLTYSVKGVSDLEMEDLLSLHDDVLDFVFQYAEPKIRRLPSHVWLRLREALGSQIVESEGGCYRWYHRRLKEIASEYFTKDKHSLHVIMAKYFGSSVDPVTVIARKISKQDWTICGRSPFHVTSVVNERRCHETVHHLLQCEGGAAVLRVEEELCNFAGICSKIRIGAGFHLMQYMSELEATPLDVYVKCGACVNTMEAQEHRMRVNHYRRWLACDIYFLLKSPIVTFLSSAALQPHISLVRKEALVLWRQIKAQQQSAPSSSVSALLAQPMGGQVNFDALLSVLEGHRHHVTTVAFSRDGDRVVSGSDEEERTLKVWDVISGAVISSLVGHSAEITAAAFNCKGNSVVSGSADQTIRIWDVDSGSSISCFLLQNVSCVYVSFVHGDTQILSVCKTRSVSLWNVNNGAKQVLLSSLNETSSSGSLESMEEEYPPVNCVAINTNGPALVAAGRDKSAYIWLVSSNELVGTLRGLHSTPVQTLSFNAEGTLLASTSKGSSIRIWGDGGAILVGSRKTYCSSDASTTTSILNVTRFGEPYIFKDTLLHTLVGHTGTVYAVEFSYDCSLLVSGSRDKTCRVWSLNDGCLVSTFAGHTAAVRSVSFHQQLDHIRVASGSDDKTVRIWAVEAAVSATAAATTTTEAQTAGAGAGAVKGNSRTEKDSVDNLLTTARHGWAVTSVAFDSTGFLIVSGSLDFTVRLWDATSGSPLSVLCGHSNFVNEVAFNESGTQVASASLDKTIRIWNVNNNNNNNSSIPGDKYDFDSATNITSSYSSGVVEATLVGHTGSVNSVAFNTGGDRIVSGSHDKTIRLWDATCDLVILVMRGHDEAVTSVKFDRSGTRIVSGSVDTTVRVWDARTGRVIMKLPGHQNAVLSVAFDWEGVRIVSGSRDKSVKVWNVYDGSEVAHLDGCKHHVTSVSFNTVGSHVVAGSRDNIIRVWNVVTGEECRQLEGHSKEIYSVALNRQGTKIVSGSHDCTVRVWDVNLM